ncbi:putative short-chain dehydrogenases/reductase [Amniculicola lignicola CBS 123094]|uniref:Putative short-chain dehydrogenases/reductase n=1 Tax=Amniculicola lignicola CBS 123094 TaxID=1392246 RepID=A0A6A5X3J1_9PLEO|nr:putative short-chain dehydrogenases/reductase [Amniculicola lignicola CBS 123094]
MSSPHPIYPTLSSKIILLTGIGQTGDPSQWGNGAATARTFILNGAKVFGCDINLSAAEATEARLLDEFPHASIGVVKADVTKKEDVRELVEACLKRYGRIDVLVNNVGRSEKGDVATMEEEAWDKQMDVNLKSVYLTCHFVLPVMEKQGGGVVVNISSIAGLRYIGKPQIAYAATKAALLHFTRATAVTYAPKNIRLNTVVPGLINTPLVKLLADKYAGGDYEGFVKQRDGQVPMGHMGTSEDVANAVVFLSSDAAKYITGTKLVVDGAITGSTGRTDFKL